jgi:hypothetical protein
LSSYLGLVGGIIVISSVAAWFYFVVSRGGLTALWGSYTQYQLNVSGSGAFIGFIYFFLGVGLSFMAASDHLALRRLALSAFGMFALFALPIGLRGEVLFPSLAAAVLAAKRGWKLSARTTLVLALVLLLAVSAVRNLRQVGVGGLASNGLDGSVTAGLVELGGSLRPVSEAVLWRQQGDELAGGGTYWAPFDRALCRVVPHESCVRADEDQRLMNVLIVQRVGPIGFSPVAEAYRNFGTPGVVGVMALIGALVGWMDKWTTRRASLALMGIIYVEMLINVRNSFVAAPSHIAVGLAILVATVVLSRSATGSEKRTTGSIKSGQTSSGPLSGYYK